MISGRHERIPVPRGRRLLRRLVCRPMKPRLIPPNPLRSEADAFGFLVWFVCLVAVIAVVVLIIQAL